MFMSGKVMRNEIIMFWRLSLESNTALRTGVFCNFYEIRDELETLGLMTDWPRLQQQCIIGVAKLSAPSLAVSA